MEFRWLQWVSRQASLSSGSSTGEILLRGCLIACAIFATIQLLTMWGTRWGDRNTLARSFFLSLLLHVCMMLGWASVALPDHPASDQDRETDSDPETIPLKRVEHESQVAAFQSTGVLASQRPALHARNHLTRLPAQEQPDELEPVIQERSSEPSSIAMNVPSLMTDLDPSVTPQRIEPTEISHQKAASVASSIIEPEQPVEVRQEFRTTIRSRQTISRGSDSQQLPIGSPEYTAAPRVTSTNDLLIPDSSTTIHHDVTQRKKEFTGKEEVRRFDVADRPVPVPVHRTARPPVVPPQEVSTQRTQVRLRGGVTDADTGQPLVGVAIRIDQIQGPPVVVMTKDKGEYEVALPQTPDVFAVTASSVGFLPEARSLRASEIENRTVRLDFTLRPLNERVIAIEAEPKVHHLGNDQFEGRINSQFQRPSEGATFSARFSMSTEQAKRKLSDVSLVLMAKGMQCPPQIRVNGVLLTRGLEASPVDGSFGTFVLLLEPGLLRIRDNVIQLNAVTCHGDLDDFEFVNLQIRLSSKE